MLRDADGELTTDQIVAALAPVGTPYSERAYYGQVYADLRVLCGSSTIGQKWGMTDVRGEGYPVVWHPWTDGHQRSTWELADRTEHADDLEALWAASR